MSDDKTDMPDELWVRNSRISIGDLAFTQENEEEGFIKYIRAAPTNNEALEALEAIVKSTALTPNVDEI